jgi:hypothetical protein
MVERGMKDSEPRSLFAYFIMDVAAQGCNSKIQNFLIIAKTGYITNLRWLYEQDLLGRYSG